MPLWLRPSGQMRLDSVLDSTGPVFLLQAEVMEGTKHLGTGRVRGLPEVLALGVSPSQTGIWLTQELHGYQSPVLLPITPVPLIMAGDFGAATACPETTAEGSLADMFMAQHG